MDKFVIRKKSANPSSDREIEPEPSVSTVVCENESGAPTGADKKILKEEKARKRTYQPSWNQQFP